MVKIPQGLTMAHICDVTQYACWDSWWEIYKMPCEVVVAIASLQSWVR